MDNKAIETYPMIEEAIAYHKRGWSVIPVGLDKRPLISWQEFQERHPTLEELKKWFGTGTTAQIGIVTGKISNLTVVDVEADGDPRPFDIGTYTVKTGGGGWHFYFTHEPDIKNSVRSLHSVDVRSEGGYVIAGESQSNKGPYAVMNEGEVLEMTESIKKLLAPKPVALPNSPRVEHHQKYEFSEVTNYPGSGSGGRNNEMTKLIGSVLARMHPDLWDSVAWPSIKRANDKNVPPLPERELRATFESIKKKELPNVSQRAYNKNIESKESQEEDVDITPERIITLQEAAKLQSINSLDFTPTNIRIFDEPLLGGISPGELVIVAGRSGTGKTTFAQDLTMSFLYEGHPALWFSFEVLAQPLLTKFKEMGMPDDGKIFVPTAPMPSQIHEIVATAKIAIEHNEVGLVVVDHIGFIDTDIKSHGTRASAITHIVRGLKKLAVEMGISVVLPVHVRKVAQKEPELEDIQDSYGIVQEADTVFLIDRKRATGEEKETSYYSDQVRIILAKNRKTGGSSAGTFSLINGRYAYDEENSRLDNQEPNAYEIKEAKRLATEEFKSLSSGS